MNQDVEGPNNRTREQSSEHRKPLDPETQPLLDRRTSAASQTSAKQLTTRNAFAVLVTHQIGSGIFASPAQVDSNVPSPGAALLVWVLGGLLSWAGAASFAELGAAIPLNGGMQAYLAYVYGDTMAFLMAWIYIMAAKPSAMAIQSIIIAESLGSISSDAPSASVMKLVAALAFLAMVLANSINTKVTIRLSESFAGLKLLTVSLVVLGGLVAVIAHFADPNSSISGGEDWYSKDWFATRSIVSEGRLIDWPSMSTWERYGHYSAAIYGGLWAFDGWDNANVVASEIRNPAQALPRAIKASMVVVLSSYELVNVAYYILLPFSEVSSNDAVAVVAMGSAFGRWAGIVASILVAASCAGSLTGNIFTVGRLTVAAAESEYLPAALAQRGLPWRQIHAPIQSTEPGTDSQINGIAFQNRELLSQFDAPIYSNILTLILTLVYILTGSFRSLLTFVGMAMWVFYVSTVVGLLILRRREPRLERPYRPTAILPMIFTIVGTIIIIRSAIFAPVQAGVLGGLMIVGTLVSKLRR